VIILQTGFTDPTAYVGLKVSCACCGLRAVLESGDISVGATSDWLCPECHQPNVLDGHPALFPSQRGEEAVPDGRVLGESAMPEGAD